MDEHISKGNYSTEVKKYITGIERSTNEKECKISSQNSKECEVEEKVVIVADNVENEIQQEPGNAEKDEYIANHRKFKLLLNAIIYSEVLQIMKIQFNE